MGLRLVRSRQMRPISFLLKRRVVATTKRPFQLFWALIFATIIVCFWRMNDVWRRYWIEEKAGPESPPMILLWWAPHAYANKGKMSDVGTSTMKQACGRCIFTNDRKLISKANAVVFHEDFILGHGHFPTEHKRSPGQKYVFWTKENPYRTLNLIKSEVGLKHYDGEFNLTMTYRSDSHVQVAYGCHSQVLKGMEKLNKIPVTKTKVAVMLASDCGRFGAVLRKNYSDLLVKAGLHVERYGKCFGERFVGDIGELLKPFKFFLSFENGIRCREYITEKFWHVSLTSGLIPVVWGPTKADVEKVAPEGSFIHAEDFASASELVRYLQYLDGNDSAYLEYFRWRNANPKRGLKQCDFPAMAKVPQGFCSLCNKIKSDTGESLIPSITDWWYGTESQECLAARWTDELGDKIARLVN